MMRRPWYLTLALGAALGLGGAVGAHAVRPTPLPQCSTSCTVNSPCEVNFSTTNSILAESVLYSIRARADFTFTGGGTPETRGVPMFYFDRPAHGSGLATFKARFTPSQVGTYSYNTVSAFAGLGSQTGSFSCSAAVPLPGGGGTNRGFLRRDPAAASPYSFIWDDGTRFFMWGQTYYQIVNQARRNTDADLAWKTAVNNSQSARMNKIRLLVSPWTEHPFTDPTRATETQPFCTGANPAACEVAAGALDFTRVNLDHFVALDEVIHYLFGRGIIAEIVIFRDPGPYGSMLGTMDQNKQYLRYVTARYAAYPNVTWSLSNEWQNADPTKANWETLGTCVRSGCTDSLGRATDADPWILSLTGNRRRPLTVHPHAVGSAGKCFDFIGSTWPNNGSLQYGRAQKNSAAGYDSIACNRRAGDPGSCPGGGVNRNIPYVNDEYGYAGTVNVRQHRNLIWGIVTGGGFGAAGDARDTTVGCPAGFPSPCASPILSTVWAAAGHFTDVQNMATFIANQGVPYWNMSPRDTCPESDNIHTLENSVNRRALVYFSQEGASPANQVTPGNYSAVWFNAGSNSTIGVACSSYPTGQVTSPPPGAPACGTPPCDWAVYLTGC